MKAVRCKKYGPPEVLQLVEIDKPVCKDNEVVVKIHSSSVTVGDARVRGFRVPPSFYIPARLALGIKGPRKSILGSIFAGEIESVGKNVSRFNIGDKVYGSNEHNFGAYAEYICMPKNGCLGVIPQDFSYSEAVSILWGGFTSLHFLKKANIRKGWSILIYGASGSLGTSAVQLAKYYGASVTGVCSKANLELVKSLGADHVIDYTATDFTEQEVKYDVIYDTVGKTNILKTIESIKSGGLYIHAVTTPATKRQIKAAIKKTQKKLIGGTLTPNSELLELLSKLAEEGVLKPVIDRTYPLAEIVEAHRYVDTGRKKGNVIISVIEE